MSFSKKATSSKQLKWQEVWTTSSGEKIKVADMTEDHAKNILNMLLKTHRQKVEQDFKKIIREECEGLYSMEEWWKN